MSLFWHNQCLKHPKLRFWATVRGAVAPPKPKKDLCVQNCLSAHVIGVTSAGKKLKNNRPNWSKSHTKKGILMKLLFVKLCVNIIHNKRKVRNLKPKITQKTFVRIDQCRFESRFKSEKMPLQRWLPFEAEKLIVDDFSVAQFCSHTRKLTRSQSFCTCSQHVQVSREVIRRWAKGGRVGSP